MATKSESINKLSSDMVLGYFETMKSSFYLKLAVVSWFESGNVPQHTALSADASTMAMEFSDELASKALTTISPEVVENLKEDATTALVVFAWTVFEQVIKDLTVPDYATQTNLLQADYHRGSIGFDQAARSEIDLFYHIRNAIVHYNGAFHAYRTVDISYRGQHFKSDGHFGDKIIVSPRLAMHIANDLQKYAMQAWSHAGRT